MPPAVAVGYPAGGIQITGTINSFLFGLTSMQSYKYFRNHMDDPTTLKMVVLFTLIFAAIHTGCLEWAIYVVAIVYNRADIPYLPQPNSAVISIISGQTAQFLVQLYWVYRIFRLQHSVVLVIALFLLVVYVFVTATVSSCFTWNRTIDWITTYQHSREFLILSQLVATAIVDVIIAALLFYHLKKNRSTRLSSTIEYIDAYIFKWTFQTGMITGVTAIAVILVFVIERETANWYCLYTSLMNLYPLTCVALLNGRSSIPIQTSGEVLTTVNGVYSSMVQRSQRQPSKVGNKYFGDIVLKLVQITPIANLEACNAPPSLSLVGQVGQDTESKFGLDSSPADKKT
ncbi:hypothetical protein AX14_003613 [Amanita brunnescens Koide BX004]|nr:hypothetical protein AX14_003613 [Amanita brunnescens Koide BX004]